MILFVDQSGQLGGAELCLADLAAHRKNDAQVVLFSGRPFRRSSAESRRQSRHMLPLPGSAARITKKASFLSLATGMPGLLAHVGALRKQIRAADLAYFNTAKALIYGAASIFPGSSWPSSICTTSPTLATSARPDSPARLPRPIAWM